MEEQLITFETAKLAKEKGFNTSNTGYRYDKKGDRIMDTPLDRLLWGTNYPIATQSLLQKWLRDIHNIHIKVDDFIDDETCIEWDYEIVIIGTDCTITGEYIPLVPYSTNDTLRQFLNYESALESGLEKALKLIELCKK
jgi:hypothetical protein